MSAAPDQRSKPPTRRQPPPNVGLLSRLGLFGAYGAVFVAGALIVGQLGGAWRSPPATQAPAQTTIGGGTQGTPTPPSSAPGPRACESDSLVGTLTVDGVRALRAPRTDARAVHTFNRTTALGTPQVFLLEDEVFGEEGELWYKALLPIRPNGSTGYIPGEVLEVAKTGYRLELDRGKFRLRLYDHCEVLETFPVGIGTGDTPTPVGRFYLASLLQVPVEGTVYGPFAYGLSGFSDVLKAWPYGGIIGLHGNNDPSSIGRKASRGCIRMHNEDIRQLVKILPLGTPIVIK